MLTCISDSESVGDKHILIIIVHSLYYPLWSKTYERTVDLTCPQIEVKDHPASLGMTCAVHQIFQQLLAFYPRITATNHHDARSASVRPARD